MSRYLEQTKCPRCPSSDAYTVYEDGSGYCFSCGYFKGVSRRSDVSMRKVISNLSGNDSRALPVAAISLPEDTSSYIPPEPLRWLKQYGITNEEIRKHHICFSEEASGLLFPVFNDTVLTGYNVRCFPQKETKTKFSGRKTISISGDKTDSCTICEDFVSAIKLSRVQSAICLFGSTISLSEILQLSSQYRQATIWLDADKCKEALRYQQRYSYVFEQGISVVRTEKDPKEYSTEEIRKFLTR